MPVWVWLLTGAASLCAVILMLYALAIWLSLREEPYLSTVWNVAKQVFTGEFFK